MNELELPVLHAKISELRALHEFCTTYQHYIMPRSVKPLVHDPQSRPRDFKASAFVYAFFTFNALYSVDWEESQRKPYMEPVAASGFQQERFCKMVAFCYKNHHDAATVYTTRLKEYCMLLGVRDPIQALAPMRAMSRQSMESKLAKQFKERQGKSDEIAINSIEEFKQAFQSVYSWQSDALENSLEDHRIAINGLLYFVYLVRNNTFHGSKDVTQLNRQQEQRLLVYAAILMAVNELLLETVTAGHLV